MYIKLFNPEVKALTLNILDTYLFIPPKEFAVVSQLVADKVQVLYSHIECGPATLEEYQVYRAKKSEPTLGVSTPAKVADIKAHQKVLEKHLLGIQAQKEADVMRAKEEELQTIQRLTDTTARLTSPSNCPEALEKPKEVAEVPKVAAKKRGRKSIK